jgi:Tol biopolymer transport system component
MRGALLLCSAVALGCASLLVSAGSASVSASSPLIVYTGDALFTGDHYRNLFTVRPNGTGVRQVTHRIEWESDPEWSPDGRHVVYSESDGTSCNAQICDLFESSVIRVVDASGQQSRAVTHATTETISCPDAAGSYTVPFIDAVPTWSPDGRLIAYDHWLFDTSGGCGGDTAQPTSRDDGIYVVGADGDAPRMVLKGSRGVRSLHWSPDGKTLAFVRHDGRIGLLDLLSGSVTFLSRGQHAAWSPDGRLLAITRSSFSCSSTDRLSNQLQPSHGGIYTVPVRGGAEKLVLNFVWGCDASWSPDGKKLVFYGKVKNAQGLFVVGSDGTGLVHVTGGGSSPDWRR